MSLDLPITIVSSDDLAAAILDLNAAAEQVSEAAVKGRGKKTAPSVELAGDLARLVEGDLTAANLRQAAINLKDLQKSAPLVELTLPDVPTPAFKAAIAHWFRASVAGNVLIDFKVNRQIAGGAVVRAGGEIYDWSFRRKILDGRQKLGQLALGSKHV